MKRVLSIAVLLLIAIACAKEKDKPLSEDGEKVYEMKGKIVARDAADNTVRVDHDRIDGFMDAMVMDYSVRGAKVAELPANNVRVSAKLHVTDNGYWLTDVRPLPER